MSSTTNNNNKKEEKIIVPQFHKTRTRISNRETKSSSVDGRLVLMGIQRTKTNDSKRKKKGENTIKVSKKGNSKFFVVDTFDAANPLDLLKGEYGSERFENISDQKLEDIVKQASLVSFPDRETPEEVYEEKEIKALFEKRNVQVSDDFRDAYDYMTKLRFHDAGRHNGVVNTILQKYAIYGVGTDFPKIVLDVNRSFPDKDMEKDELMKMKYNFIYYRIKNELEKLDKKVDTREAMYATIVNSKQYGRCCHLIQDDPDTGMPVALKLLNSMRLGRVYTNSLDWKQVEGIQYLDFKKPQNIIFKENMIYGINRNYHQSPNSYNYGYSDIEPIKYLVELNTIIDSMDLKQKNKRGWAPLLIVKVPSDDKLAVAKLRDAYKRFTSVFTTLEHETQQIPINDDGEFLLKEREKNDIKISEDMGMPLILNGKEMPNTKATASQILQSFNNTTVKDLRIWLRHIFEHQWYGRNILKIIKKIFDEQKSGEKDPILEEEREIFDRFIEKSKQKKKNEIKALIRQSNLYNSIATMPTQQPPAQTQTKKVSQVDENGKPITTEEEITTQEKTREELQQEQEMKDREARGEPPIPEEEDMTPEEKMKQQQEQQDKVEQSVSMIDTIIDKTVEDQFKELVEDEQKTIDKLIQFEEPEDLPFKVKVTFDKITFDTDLERAAYITGLMDKEIVDLEKAQDELDQEDMIEKTKLAQEAETILEDILIQLRAATPRPPEMGGVPDPDKVDEDEQAKQVARGSADPKDRALQKNSKISDGFAAQSLKSTRNKRSAVQTKTTGV